MSLASNEQVRLSHGWIVISKATSKMDFCAFKKAMGPDAHCTWNDWKAAEKQRGAERLVLSTWLHPRRQVLLRFSLTACSVFDVMRLKYSVFPACVSPSPGTQNSSLMTLLASKCIMCFFSTHKQFCILQFYWILTLSGLTGGVPQD